MIKALKFLNYNIIVFPRNVLIICKTNWDFQISSKIIAK